MSRAWPLREPNEQNFDAWVALDAAVPHAGVYADHVTRWTMYRYWGFRVALFPLRFAIDCVQGFLSFLQRVARRVDLFISRLEWRAKAGL